MQTETHVRGHQQIQTDIIIKVLAVPGAPRISSTLKRFADIGVGFKTPKLVPNSAQADN